MGDELAYYAIQFAGSSFALGLGAAMLILGLGLFYYGSQIRQEFTKISAVVFVCFGLLLLYACGFAHSLPQDPCATRECKYVR